MSIIYLETFNIEWGQIDPKHNRRVNIHTSATNVNLFPRIINVLMYLRINTTHLKSASNIHNKIRC